MIYLISFKTWLSFCGLTVCYSVRWFKTKSLHRVKYDLLILFGVKCFQLVFVLFHWLQGWWGLFAESF